MVHNGPVSEHVPLGERTKKVMVGMRIREEARNILIAVSLLFFMALFSVDVPAELIAGESLVTRKAQKTEYAQWGRNPFMPKGESAGSSLKLVLSGIVENNGEICAVVNGVIMKKGDAVNETITIEDIKRNSVIVAEGSRRYELRLD